jgi:hypothetical protein
VLGLNHAFFRIQRSPSEVFVGLTIGALWLNVWLAGDYSTGRIKLLSIFQTCWHEQFRVIIVVVKRAWRFSKALPAITLAQARQAGHIF